MSFVANGLWNMSVQFMPQYLQKFDRQDWKQRYKHLPLDNPCMYTRLLTDSAVSVQGIGYLSRKKIANLVKCRFVVDSNLGKRYLY